MKKNTKVIVIILVALEIISIYFMYKSSHNKEMKLDNVKLKEDVDYNRFAIYLDGEKYTEESFPTESLLDLEKTKCMNEKGDIIENPKITYTSNSLTIVNTETTYCTLYFNRCTGPTNTVLKGKSDITKCPVGGMYRYQGTDNVNNWICFGTTDKEECTSETGIGKYMYRIIGVTPEGELALIKETGVTGFKWNDKYTTEDCESDGSKCVWPLSKIYNSLNGLCNLNNEHCQEETNIFIGNSYYEYLNEGSIWLNKITNHEWKYGATNGNNGNYDGDSIYIIESQFPNVIPAKIGLQYLHDFYYAYPGGKPKSHDIAKTSWIHLSKDEISGIIDEWLISQSGANSNTISSWAITRYDISNSDLFYSNGVRPVFYLKNDTTFKDGSGSKEDPYIIEIPEPAIVTQLRQSDDNNSLSEDLVGGLYRYQGTDNVNNYICFGTTNKEECVKGGDNYDDGIDKYMYRIIGVTPEGELALIKETSVKEEYIPRAETEFVWNDKFTTTECGEDGSLCTWANSKLYNRINGLCKEDNTNCTGSTSGTFGTSNIFIGNSYYEYLNEGSTWLEKINAHTWKYGDVTKYTSMNDFPYNGDTIYEIENEFNSNVTSKIGLQYIHDYYYAYPDGSPGDMNIAKTSWIYFQKDGYNTGIKFEWLISKFGVNSSSLDAFDVDAGGGVGYVSVLHGDGVRPVFYLKSDIKISNAEGSKTDPFIINE